MSPTDGAVALRPSTQYSPGLLRPYGADRTEPDGIPPNAVIGRLRRELQRLRRITGAYVGPDGTPFGNRPRLGTRASWALLWREWALEDLGEAVAEMRRAYVVNRGDVTCFRLFLDGEGAHMLAVRPDAPAGPFRYQKLTHNAELAELFSVYARLVFTPPR